MTLPDHRDQSADHVHDDALDWDAIYWEYMPGIYNFFRYRVGDDQIAQDLTATTFTRAWRARDRYDAALGTVQAWLFTIARNAANDHLRRSMRRKEVSLDAVLGLASAASVEQEAQRRREFERLHALLKMLPEREQELISMKYGAGMTNRAIAEATGLSESNIGTILHRVVQRLRGKWYGT